MKTHDIHELASLNKVEGKKFVEGEVFAVIIEVNEANYLPSGIELRSRISPFIFTANLSKSYLHKLEQDPKVESIAHHKGLCLL